MSSKTKYTDAPTDVDQALDNAIVIEDFLPSPAELVRKAEKERITIAIDKHTLDLYRVYAKKNKAKYQSMINEVVGAYADKFLDR